MNKYPLIVGQCKQCNNEFKLSKHNILRVLNPNTKRTGDFCSDACRRNARKTKKSVVCLNCNRVFEKLPNQIKKLKIISVHYLVLPHIIIKINKVVIDVQNLNVT